jgi:predicted anti-sigma-YlaC factor YlaD
MSCEELRDKLVEKSRRQMEPGASLRTHLRSCPDCRDRWEEQENLTAHLKAIRYSVHELRSPDSSRAMLMERFRQQKRIHVIPARWYWGLAAAAALILCVVAIPDLMRRSVPLGAPARSVAVADSSAYSSNAAELQSDGTADTEADGFMAVPFVPPLATGEMLRVVHTELNPAELASLGVSVDPAWRSQLPADLLLGEDGMPRAVRVSDTVSENGSF